MRLTNVYRLRILEVDKSIPMEGICMKLHLSDSEWKLMKQLWDQAPKTIMELTAELKEETGWSKNTVITMLSRLEQKQAVRYEEGERARRYFPCLNREDASRQETESFLDKVYGGSLGLMMRAMVDNCALTGADIEELSEILRKAGKKK